ncbi:hypothetical protein OF83DRAFT_150748 [Amylostereum chailletii]|nr:hypothetical protein OF83DRAFT_150748 [Amylostereum chailletii]
MFSPGNSTTDNLFAAAALRVMQRISSKFNPVKKEDSIDVTQALSAPEDLLSLSIDYPSPSAPLLVQAPFEEPRDFIPVFRPVQAPVDASLCTVDDVKSNLAISAKLTPYSHGLGIILDETLDTKTFDVLEEDIYDNSAPPSTNHLVPRAPLLLQAPFEESGRFVPVSSPVPLSCNDALVTDAIHDAETSLSKTTARNVGLGMVSDATAPITSTNSFSFGHLFRANTTSADEYALSEYTHNITSADLLFLDHFFKVSTACTGKYLNGTNHFEDTNPNPLFPSPIPHKRPVTTGGTGVPAHLGEAQSAVVEIAIVDAHLPTVSVGPSYGSPASTCAFSLGEGHSLLEAPNAWTDVSSYSSALPTSTFTTPPSPAISSISEISSANAGSKPVLQAPKESLVNGVTAWIKRTARRRV